MKAIILLFVGLSLTFMLPAQVSKTIDVTAGNLKTVLTASELSTITNLILTGTIDARDFKTMCVDMPLLSVIDLTGIVVKAYTGTQGTSWRTDYPANEIPEYAFWNEIAGSKINLLSILIPSSVTTIGEAAFSGCSGLTSINLSTSIVAIKQSAFSGCSSLISVIIPSSVIYIGATAFSGCSSLTSITIPSSVTSIEYGTFWDCKGLISVDIPSSVTSIGMNAFVRCSSLVSATIPSTVISIGESAFDGCFSWTGALIIPSSVTTIEKLTFNNCSSLTSLVIPSSVTSIGESAFSGCTGLTGTLTIPSLVTSIGSWTFNNCSGLNGPLIIPPLVTSIKNNTFSGCIGFTSVTIPSSVTSIEYGAFKNCSSLNSIYVHSLFPVQFYNSLEVFSGVDKTTCTLYVPYGARELYAAANEWKDFTHIVADTQGFKLSSYTLNFDAEGGNNSTIHLDANVGWTANSDQPWLTVSPTSGNSTQPLTIVTEANLSGATRKGTIIFSATGFLSQTISVIQESNPKHITVTAGGLVTALTGEEKSSITHLSISGTIDARDFKTIHDEMPMLAVLDLSRVTIAAYSDTEAEYPAYYAENSIPGHVSMYIPKASLQSYAENAFAASALGFGTNYSLNRLTALTSVILPSSLISIGMGAFYGCSSLTSMVIPLSVDTIGADAFMDCNGLTSCIIPPSVKSIGEAAFSGCSALTSIELQGTLRNIENWTFSYCSALKFIDIPPSVVIIGSDSFIGCSELSTIAIPSSVTLIGGEAFSGCSALASVNIPSSVTMIDIGAFQDCSGLTSVNFPQSVNFIGQTAFFGCRNLTSIYAYGITPIDLTNAVSVFYEVNKDVCILYVPFGSSRLYAAAPEWKEFKNIVEMPELKLSQTTANVEAAKGSTATVEITSNVIWTASCDQPWLLVNPLSGTGSNTLAIIADANLASAARKATVTLKANGVDSKTIAITQQTLTVGVIEIEQEFAQFKCYPNPFTQEIAIEIKNPKQEKVTVDIYNMAGQLIKNLLIGSVSEQLNLSWNGTNERGHQVPPGVYICKVNQQSRQLIFGGQ